MMTSWRIFPEQASTTAARVDGLYVFLLGVAIVFTGLIFLLLLYFAITYRRRPGNMLARQVGAHNLLEAAWILIPLAITMVVFVWGARLYAMVMLAAPENALEVYAVGKQWMWKFQHPDGAREIDELHVPVGSPVKMIMASQDVIHSFYVPAFRIKMDVVPGRYTTIWFEASKPGVYHLFCAEYCGTVHSGMRGRVVALPPAQYQTWLSSNRTVESMPAAGAHLFQQMGCAACHAAGNLAPALEGVFGSAVQSATSGKAGGLKTCEPLKAVRALRLRKAVSAGEPRKAVWTRAAYRRLALTIAPTGPDASPLPPASGCTLGWSPHRAPPSRRRTHAPSSAALCRRVAAPYKCGPWGEPTSP